MSPLVLHSFRRCPFAIRVRMVLEEKGLAYTVREEDLGNPSPELLRIHPSGKVPVLVHEGQVIPESAVITEYLEEICPEPALMPASAVGRAEVRLWTHWCAESLKPALDAYKYEWESRSAESREELLGQLRSALDLLDSALGAQPFLLEERLTLADIHVFPFYRQLTRAKQAPSGLLAFPPRLNAWLDRITSRETFVRVMARST
jgi:glutathione S-transferase